MTRTWLDEGEVSSQWPPPAGDSVRRSRQRGLVYGGVVLAMVLLLAVVWGAGGFGRRTDLLRPVDPGALISTGPFELAFTEATARHVIDSKGTVTAWQIVVIGQARTTGGESIAPKYSGSDSMFAVRDLASKASAESKSATIGEPDELGRSPQRSLAPGLPPTAYRLTFELPPSYQPGTTIVLGVMDLEFQARYLTSDEEGWFNGSYGSRVDLPLRVLPD